MSKNGKSYNYFRFSYKNDKTTFTNFTFIQYFHVEKCDLLGEPLQIIRDRNKRPKNGGDIFNSSKICKETVTTLKVLSRYDYW